MVSVFNKLMFINALIGISYVIIVDKGVFYCKCDEVGQVSKLYYTIQLCVTDRQTDLCL